MRVRVLTAAAGIAALAVLATPVAAQAATPATPAAPSAPAASAADSTALLYKWRPTNDVYGKQADCNRRAAWWFDTHADVYGAECRWNSGLGKWQVWIQR
ncbi:hypothetical protein ACWEQL_40350 [Kitasatospora sp. NPDC004240]